MSSSDPRTIVQRYNDEVWTSGDPELIREIVANPLRRHHPGVTQVFTHEEMIRRFESYRQRDPHQKVVARLLVCEGPYVTLLWDYQTQSDGRAMVLSGIEIFKVVDGRITEVWNPNAVAEQYPAGPWPDLG